MSRPILTIIFLMTCPVATAQANDFDKVCHFFSSLEDKNNQRSMSHKERNQFISGKISNQLSSHSNARIAWEAIAFASSEQRYALFKSGAESVIKRKWDCDAMKRLAHITGEFE